MVYKPTFYKTVNLFSDIMSHKLYLKMRERGRCNTHNWTISINTDSPLAENEQEIYTLLEHELAHNLFDSDIRAVDHLDEEFGDLYTSVVKHVWNFVEDYRVESLWGEIYPGSKAMFDVINERLINTEADSPISVLAATYARKPDLVRDEYDELFDFFKEKLNDVEGTTPEYAIKVSRQILERIKDYYKNKEVERRMRIVQGSPRDVDGEPETPENDLNQEQEPREEDEEPSLEELAERGADRWMEGFTDIDEEDVEMDEGEIEDEAMEELNDDALDDIREQINANLTEPKTHKPDFDADPDRDEALSDGMDRAEEIEERLEQREVEVPDNANIVGEIIDNFDGEVPFDYDEYFAKPNRRVINGLQRTFRKIKSRAQSTTDVEGYEIDFDNLIQRKAGNRNVKRVFRAERNKVGLNVTVLVDISSSMYLDNRMKSAIDAVLNIWEALDGIDEVNIDCYAYAGSEDNYKTPVWKLSKKKLTNGLCPLGETHTHRALKYIGNKISKKKGKKLILLVTDGLPEGGGSRDWDAKELTGYIVSQLRQKEGIMLYSVFIGKPESGDDEITEEELMTMFGSEETFTRVKDYTNLFDALVKGVGRKVINLFY